MPVKGRVSFKIMARLKAQNTEDSNAYVLVNDTMIFGVDHVSLLVFEGGEWIVYHNNVQQRNEHGGSILREPLAVFIKDREIIKKTPVKVNLKVLKAYVHLHRKRRYNVLNWTCEDFINEILTGKGGSPQREKWSKGILAGTVLLVSGVAAYRQSVRNN